MEIKIHSVRRVGVNPNQTLATISIADQNNGEPFGYFIALDNEDDSEIYKYVISKIKSGEVEILPTETDVDAYYAQQARELRNKLLSETDKYMTLDYPISEDDRKSIREYRQALRDITKQEGFPTEIEWPVSPLAK